MESAVPRSSVYGPVRSWRYGWSLGVDLLLETSICSFNCIYCQLGDIEIVTREQKVYVPTERIVEDLKQVDMDRVDIVAISGSGEPTLALNLGEVIHHIKETYEKPVMILTNASLLTDPATRARVREADIVDCKLDSASDETLEKFNRPAAGITVSKIVEGIQALRAEYPGKLHLQCMFMPMNVAEAQGLARLIRDIRPDRVQLNTPKRPYPKQWELILRGDHERKSTLPRVSLKTISREQAREIQQILEQSGVPVLSVYPS